MNYTNEMTLWNNSAWDRLFDDFLNAIPTARVSKEVETFVPACELAEGEGHYLLTLEVPGVSKDDLKVEVFENQVMVSGERRQERGNVEHGARYSERRFGKFQRSFKLPTGIDSNKIEASYEDGILHLMVPKAETAKPRQIKITQGGSAGILGKLLGASNSEKNSEKVA